MRSHDAVSGASAAERANWPERRAPASRGRGSQRARQIDNVYTIGFAQRSARDFFETLRDASVRRLVDVRLKNVNQLAGFTKRGDLEFFLRELCGAEYVHEPLLAPSPELFAFRRKEGGDWATYERRFLALMAERCAEERIDPDLLGDATVLLCTEHSPDQCHRRLVLQYLGEHWGRFDVVHL